MSHDSHTKPILNVADAPRHAGTQGEHFAFSMSMLAGPLGAKAIGANVTRVPPGKAAFPFHHHYANEEHFFVLGGTGLLRIGEHTYAVKPQDYIVNVPGGPELAHQFVNTGTEDLVYLAISTLLVPEVVGYPDSAKTGVRVAPGQEPGSRFLVLDADKPRVAYYDGEDGARVADIVRNNDGRDGD
jgi:uncharacterized cupin superfamily protein